MKKISKILLTAFVIAGALSLTGCPKEAGEGNGGGGSGSTTYPTSWAGLSTNDSLIGTWEFSYENIQWQYSGTIVISNDKIDIQNIASNKFSEQQIQSKSLCTDVVCKKYSQTRGKLVFYSDTVDGYEAALSQDDSYRLHKYVDTDYEFTDENTLKILRLGDYGSLTYSTSKQHQCQTAESAGWTGYSENETLTLTRKTN